MCLFCICSDGLLSVLITHQETATRFDLANSDRLVRGREYTVTLAARNSIGFSDESTPVYYSRPETATNQTATNQTATNQTATNQIFTVIIIILSVLGLLACLLLSVSSILLGICIFTRRRATIISSDKQSIEMEQEG